MPTVSSFLSSAVQKLPLKQPRGAFCRPNIVSPRAGKLSSCLVSGGICCGVQDALLSGLRASYLFCAEALFGAKFVLLESANCPPSWLFELSSSVVLMLPSCVISYIA